MDSEHPIVIHFIFKLHKDPKTQSITTKLELKTETCRKNSDCESRMSLAGAVEAMPVLELPSHFLGYKCSITVYFCLLKSLKKMLKFSSLQFRGFCHSPVDIHTSARVRVSGSERE